ncbi:hypothetical protein ACI6PS_01560 [Flavobacterium sp. PLA-1-15]|uniref:hypothetical protein n=1 Tax=Flavobacterium sp. PLA-1-15 TaxID=3380533 RepID=UPI003B78522E
MEHQQHNFEKLPDIETIQKIILEISCADFSQLSYTKLIQKIRSLVFIPFASAKLKSGHYIERARINKPDQIFYSEKDLSYRTDYENIKTYGRANVPHNSLFYGAYESEAIALPRYVNLMETSEIFRNLETNNVDNADFIMTVGKWKIINEMEIVEVVFDEKSIENSVDIQRAFEFHSERLKNELPQFVVQFQAILKFFSNQFAKKNIKSHFDYMPSAAYTDLAINWRRFPGIAYPSVKTEFKGQNVVLSPSAVDANLQLEVVSMFRVLKKGKNTTVIPMRTAIDFGPMNTRFKWIDTNNEDFTI